MSLTRYHFSTPHHKGYYMDRVAGVKHGCRRETVESHLTGNSDRA